MNKKCGVCKKTKDSKFFSERKDNRPHTLKWACKDCIKKQQRDKYRLLAKDPNWVKTSNARNRKRWRTSFEKNPEKHNERTRKWRENNPERTKEHLRKQRLKVRLAVLIAYSGKNPRCKCCGEKDLDFLAVDHIDSGGNKHRADLKRRGQSLYYELKKLNYPPGYQILCHNCNYKKYLRGKCSH